MENAKNNIQIDLIKSIDYKDKFKEKILQREEYKQFPNRLSINQNIKKIGQIDNDNGVE